MAFGAALAMLPDMTPARLSRLLGDDSAAQVYDSVLSRDRDLAARLAARPVIGASHSAKRPADPSWRSAGETPPGRVGLGDDVDRTARIAEVLSWWSRELSGGSVGELWVGLTTRGVEVIRRGDRRYPPSLARLRLAPELLFVKGDIDIALGPCVGVVGTRRATHYGIEIANELGRGLTERGVCVVSGLARGIDAAAHSGALSAFERSEVGSRPGRGRPLAVNGGGVDVVYPRSSERLYAGVVARGVVVSEAPPKAPPAAWRFPLRNRIIAALSHVLVVVESSRQGGAMHTVEAADQIGVPVLAVPGSVRSAQSEGTNQLIKEGGAALLTDELDVVAALELALAGSEAMRTIKTSQAGGARLPGGGGAGKRHDQAALCTSFERDVLDAVDTTVTSLNRICERVHGEVAAVAVALERLEELKLARPDGPGWVRL
ncbi:MAG: DNA-processing protein DprA [Acidimicrobiales bacterium]